MVKTRISSRSPNRCLHLNLIPTSMQASLEKCPLLIRKVIVLSGKRAGNTKGNKRKQPDECTWLFFDLCSNEFYETYDYLVFLGVSETRPELDIMATSTLVNGVVAAHHHLDVEPPA